MDEHDAERWEFFDSSPLLEVDALIYCIFIQILRHRQDSVGMSMWGISSSNPPLRHPNERLDSVSRFREP